MKKQPDYLTFIQKCSLFGNVDGSEDDLLVIKGIEGYEMSLKESLGFSKKAVTTIMMNLKKTLQTLNLTVILIIS